MSVAVLVEKRDGQVSEPTLQAITLARSLGEPVAIWLGEAPDAAAVAKLARYGAKEVRNVALAEDVVLADVRAAAIETALTGSNILIVLSTFVNKEIATQLAYRIGAGVVVDAAGAKIVDGKVETTQTVFAATWNVRTRINTDKAIVGIRANTTQAVPVENLVEIPVQVIDFAVPATNQVEVVEVRRTELPAGVPLAEAPVVVSGGRGTAGDYTLVQELADLLGGAVGASRDATDEGWISHDHMVGQTGTTVTPSLYVACGISGAVHHRGGMQASGTIVAVNLDPDAPIFEIADFGVVGSLFEVLPQTIDKIRTYQSESYEV